MTILTKLLPPASSRHSRSSSRERAQREPQATEKPKTEKPVMKAYQAVANAVGTLQSYQDIPLQYYRQSITAFLAVLVVFTIITGLYLNITSRTALTGREIFSMQSKIIKSQRENANIETEIALLLSSKSLEERARAIGYKPLTSENIEYISVPGYYAKPMVDLSTPVTQSMDIRKSPEFSESLFAWLARQLQAASLPLAQGN